MEMDLKNLDDVQQFIRKNFPGWKMHRGKKNFADVYQRDVPEHAEDFEVIVLYAPNKWIPVAEFWKGYYDFFPENFTGLCGGYHCMGSLEFAMRSAMDELKRRTRMANG